jgi:hypothetical protein
MAPHHPTFHPFFGILLIPASHGLPSSGMQRGRDHLGKTIEQAVHYIFKRFDDGLHLFLADSGSEARDMHCNVKAFIVLRPPTHQPTHSGSSLSLKARWFSCFSSTRSLLVHRDASAPFARDVRTVGVNAARLYPPLRCCNVTERRSKPNAGKVSFYKCNNLLRWVSLSTSVLRVVRALLPSALHEHPGILIITLEGESRRRETQLSGRSLEQLYAFRPDYNPSLLTCSSRLSAAIKPKNI